MNLELSMRYKIGKEQKINKAKSQGFFYFKD